MQRVFGVIGLTKLCRQISLFRGNRRIFLGVMIVVVMLIAPVLAISMSEVSKLTITLVNSSDQDLRVRVWVDKFRDCSTILEPQESISFDWNITGWPIHRYDILWHPTDILVSYYQSWTYILVVPFTERTIALEVG